MNVLAWHGPGNSWGGSPGPGSGWRWRRARGVRGKGAQPRRGGLWQQREGSWALTEAQGHASSACIPPQAYIPPITPTSASPFSHLSNPSHSPSSTQRRLHPGSLPSHTPGLPVPGSRIEPQPCRLEGRSTQLPAQAQPCPADHQVTQLTCTGALGQAQSHFRGGDTGQRGQRLRPVTSVAQPHLDPGL